jgi:hypothetical protein
MVSSIDIKGTKASERLSSLGLNNDFGEANLAKNFVLFNGVSSVSGNKEDLTFNPSTNNKDYFAKNSDFSLINSYGFAGLGQGLRPMPGIEAVRVSYVNRGTLANAEIDIIAFNKEQLNIIDTLFLHPGYSFLLEWGWTRYIDNTTGNIIHNNPQSLITDPFKRILDKSNTQYTILNSIKEERKNQSGNYDALFLIVKNFKFSFQPNGTYKITVYGVTQGDVIENLKINTVSPGKGAKGLQQQVVDQDTAAKIAADKKAELETLPDLIEAKRVELEDTLKALERAKTPTSMSGGTGGGGGTINFELVSKREKEVESLEKELNALKEKPEQLRVDILKLIGEDVGATNIVDRLANKSRIHLWLKEKRDYAQSNTDGKAQNILSMKVERIEYKKETLEDGTVVQTSDTANDFLYFVKLGYLLDFIQSRLLIYSTNTTNPYFKLDTGRDNYCFHFPKHISADPEICLIPVQDGPIKIPQSYKTLRDKPKKIAETQRKIEQAKKDQSAAQFAVDLENVVQSIGDPLNNNSTNSWDLNNALNPTTPPKEEVEPQGILGQIQAAQATPAEKALKRAKEYVASLEGTLASISGSNTNDRYYGALPSTFQSNAGGGNDTRQAQLEKEAAGRVFENVVAALFPNGYKEGTVEQGTLPIPGTSTSVEVIKIKDPNSFLYVTRSRFFRFASSDGTPSTLVDQGSWTIINGTFKPLSDKEPGASPELQKPRDINDIEAGLTSQNLSTGFIVNSYVGRLMDIHLNMEYVATVANNNMDKEGNLSLISFLNQLLTGMNAALGYCHEFQVVYDRETNYVKIYDNKILNYGGLKTKKHAPAFFNLFGFNPVKNFNLGSFIYDVNFTSQLTNNFVNMVTIAAQADTNVLGMEYTGFINYNAGLVDRIITEKKSIAELGVEGGSSTEDLSNLYSSAKTFAQDIWGTLSINRAEVDAFMSTNRDIANYEINSAVNAGLTPNPTIIPYNLSLSMMGLSGMKIFERFDTDDKILPPMYDNSQYNFVVKALSHTITNNKWTTTLESQVINKEQNDESIDVSGDVAEFVAVVQGNSGPRPKYGPDNIPDSLEGCAKVPGELNEPIVTSKIIIDYYGNYMKGKKSMIEKVEKAYTVLKAQGITLEIADNLRRFSTQKTKYLEYQEKLKRGEEAANVSHPCNGYHTRGQAMDIRQSTAQLIDITSHGPIYKAMYDAGLRRISNEWWHWGIGETDHDINKKFTAHPKSPGDKNNYTRY